MRPLNSRKALREAYYRRVAERYDFRCSYCGDRTPYGVVGTDGMAEYDTTGLRHFWCCYSCHSRLGEVESPEQLRRQLGMERRDPKFRFFYERMEGVIHRRLDLDFTMQRNLPLLFARARMDAAFDLGEALERIAYCPGYQPLKKRVDSFAKKA